MGVEFEQGNSSGQPTSAMPPNSTTEQVTRNATEQEDHAAFSDKKRSAPKKVGFIGLGKIGNTMAGNLVEAGFDVVGYDPYLTDAPKCARVDSLEELIADDRCVDTNFGAVVISVLPNDAALSSVFLGEKGLAKRMPRGAIHVSTSTVSPKIAKELEKVHKEHGSIFVSCPVFARPDGLAKREAYFALAGPSNICDFLKKSVLNHTAIQCFYFGENAHLANVVKCCGNFMICSAIEAMSEAFNLSEAYGVDRKQFHEMMSSTIFNCLIYKGYGHRVSAHDHEPYPNAHFALELGHKDMLLTKAAAEDIDVKVPPILDIVDKKFEKAKEQGLGKQDWSAVSLVE